METQSESFESDRNHPPVTKTALFILIGIVGISLLLNLWGIKQNLPYVPEIDEKSAFIGPAVRMAGTGSANPGWFGNPGSTIHYPLALVYRLLYGADAQNQFERDPAVFYLLGRILSALYGAFSIPFIFLIGRKAFGEKVGLLGAWLFLLYPLVIAHFQVVRTDSAAVFFGMFSLWRILETWENPTLGNHIAAGVLIGLSIASRYFMAALIPVLFLADLLAMKQNPGSPKKLLRYALIGTGAVAFTFALSTPYLFLDFWTAAKNLRFEARTVHVGADGLSPIGNFWWYLTSAIPLIMTWPQYVLALAGGLLILRKKSPASWIIWGYALAFLAQISVMALHWTRWTFPFIPILSLTAAYALDTLNRRISRSPKLFNAVLAIEIIGLSAWPAYQTVLQNLQNSQPSTRIMAREWVVANLPPGSRIAEEFYTAPLERTGFEFTETFTLSSKKNLEYYISEGYDYLIVCDTQYDRFYSEPERYPEEVKFYDSLFEQGRLIQEFVPTPIRGGPAIRIYELPNHSAP